MAPKPAAPPPLDYDTSVAALDNEDPAVVLPAVQFLAAQDAKILELEEEAVNDLASKLAPHMTSSNADIRTTTLKMCNKFVIKRGTLIQQAMLQEAVMQANWAALNEFGTNFEEYKTTMEGQAEAVAAAAAEAASKKGGKGAGAVPAIDAEAILPVPSKFALDAALRYINTAAIFKPDTVTWIEGQDSPGKVLVPLVLLLQHHALRVQLRALCLLQTLLQSPSLTRAALLAGAASALVALLNSSSYGATKLAVIRVVLALCSQPGAQHVQLLELNAVETLVQLILEPETGKLLIPEPPMEDVPEAVQEDGASPPPPAPAPDPTVEPVKIDYSKPEKCTPEELQMDALKALLCMCTMSSASSARLAHIGGLNLLMKTITKDKPPVPLAEVPEGEDTPPIPSPSLGPFDIGGESICGQRAEEGDWTACLHTCLFAAPPFKFTVPEMQSYLLKIIASMLAHPGLQEALSNAREHVSTSQLLLNFFVNPPEPPKPATPPPEPPPSGKGKASVKSAKTPAKGKAPKEEPPPVKVLDPLDPPFPSLVKAAALEGLVLLAKHGEHAVALSPEAEVRRLVEGAAMTDPMAAPSLATLLQLMLPHLVDPPPPTPPPPPPPGMPIVPKEEEVKPKGPVTRAEAVNALKDLACVMLHGSKTEKATVARASLVLPDGDIIAKARPPLASPPPTPAPPPLATSLYVWDALGRPQMTDGNAKLVHVEPKAVEAKETA